MPKTIFITGTSSGLGKRTALYFAQQRWNVAATMRARGGGQGVTAAVQAQEEPAFAAYPNIRVFRLDVTDRGQVAAAVKDAIAAFGRIDVVVNNAGMGTYGALELATEEAIDWQYAVNVRGVINVIRAFLPHFRGKAAEEGQQTGVEQRGGMFINISSSMGLATGVPLGSLYAMSKFALEGLTEGLFYELKALNIDIHLIEQGGSEDNNFVRNIAWNTHESIRDYDALTARVQHRMATAGPEMKSDPQEIVDAIYAIATGASRQFRTPIGKATHMLLGMRGSMPIEEYLEKIRANFV